MRGQGPSNINAAASAEVQQSPAIAALLEQSEFSQLQRVGGKFWDPVTAFALNMAAGNATGEQPENDAICICCPAQVKVGSFAAPISAPQASSMATRKRYG